jgi:hypothetical protein
VRWTRTWIVLLPFVAACPAEKAAETPPVEKAPPMVEPPPPPPPPAVEPPPVPAGPFVDVRAVSSDRYQLVEESEWVRLLLATFKPGQRDQPHSHPRSVIYALTAISGNEHQPNGAKPISHAAGTAFVREPVSDFVFENSSSEEVRFLVYELEPNAPPPEEFEEKPEGDPVAVSPDVYKVLAETPEARLLLLSAKAGVKDKPHAIHEHMTYTLTDVKGRYHFGRMQNIAVKKNMAHSQPAVPSLSFENMSSKPAEVLIFERK